MKTVVVSLSLLVLGVAISQNATSQQPPDARVISAKGAWVLDRQLLARGNRFKPGAEATAASGGDLLVDCGPSARFSDLRSYSCPGACAMTVCATTANRVKAEIPSDWWSILFRREAREPVLAAARAGGNPSDAVLLQDAKGTHWGPALGRVLEGRYCLRLGSLPAGASGTTFSLDWDRAIDSEGIRLVPDLRPGLYGLDIGTPDGTGCRLDADASTAWVLVAPSADFARVNGEWKAHGVSIAELERSGAVNTTVSSIRHAVLAGLAESLVAR